MYCVKGEESIMVRMKAFMNVQNPTIFPITFKDLTWELKAKKVYGNEIVVMYACTLWEWVYEFIDGQRCEEGRKVQWNIAKNMVGEFKIKQAQIDS